MYEKSDEQGVLPSAGLPCAVLHASVSPVSFRPTCLHAMPAPAARLAEEEANAYFQRVYAGEISVDGLIEVRHTAASGAACSSCLHYFMTFQPAPAVPLHVWWCETVMASATQGCLSPTARTMLPPLAATVTPPAAAAAATAAQVLKGFKNSTLGREQEVFACMVHNLFDEYRFFPKYPDKELHTTGACAPPRGGGTSRAAPCSGRRAGGGRQEGAGFVEVAVGPWSPPC